MVKNNYKAWHISDKFNEDWSDIDKLKFFVKYAILSPSAHNTQPWNFKIDNNSLLIEINHDRKLQYSGDLVGEPYVSIGACIETLKIAAHGYGYNVEIIINDKPEFTANIKIVNKIEQYKDLLVSITNRSSDRSNYNQTKIKDNLINSITQNNFSNVSLFVISDIQDIKFISKQTYEATINVMTDKKFREELSHWVRNNKTRKYDGMPGFVQGMPLPPSLIAKHVIKNINISKSQAKKDAKSIVNSSHICIISSKDKSIDSLVQVGRLYASISIFSELNNISSSGISAAIVDNQTRQNIINKFKLEENPITLIRLGYSSAIRKHTPRRPSEKHFQNNY